MQPYLRRRTTLMDHMLSIGGGVAIIPTAPEVMRNSDSEYPYRHDSAFYYLSGFTEPEAVIVLVVPRPTQLTSSKQPSSPPQSLLFCRSKNPEREVWDGFRYGPQAAQTHFGFDAAFSIDELDVELPKRLCDAPAVFYSADPRYDARLETWFQAVRRYTRGSGVRAPGTRHDVRPWIDEMRLVKDEHEVRLMRRAAEISAEAHCRAMRAVQPGLVEYQLEAEILQSFRSKGAQFPAYGSIVAGGANACVLHYRANNAALNNGDLVLIDAGCELDSYAADITRTFPVNGRFSPAQKNLYEIVLSAQTAAIQAIRPGARVMDGHEAALRVLSQGLLDLGLLDKAVVGNVEDVIQNEAYLPFYMHRTSHWLGMDVHDVGNYHEVEPYFPNGFSEGNIKPWRTLAPGMTLTVEPGLYVRPTEGVPEAYWNVGIRIEDDILVTERGCEVMSEEVPRTVVGIEVLMGH